MMRSRGRIYSTRNQLLYLAQGMAGIELTSDNTLLIMILGRK